MAVRDEEILLVERVKKGDTKSYEHLFNKYIEALSLLSFRIVRNRTVAEEVVQDFFARYWMRKEEITISTSFKAYAFRSVHNASLNAIRNKHKFTSFENLANTIEAEEMIPEDLIDGEQLRKAVDSLPLQCRNVFTLVCVEGLSYAEVAEEMGISVNTVKVQISKAYRRLREQLSCKVLISIIIASFI